MNETDDFDFGPCCACGKEITTGYRNILCLHQRAPVPGTGWGCLVCGLPMDGAIAILCDDCLANEADIKQVVYGRSTGMKRVPIESLDPAPFDHNPEPHKRDEFYDDWYERRGKE